MMIISPAQLRQFYHVRRRDATFGGRQTVYLSSAGLGQHRAAMEINSLLNMRALMNIAVVNILQNPFFTHFILNEICCNDAAMAILVQLKMK
ncbi:hypothetical protein DJ508_12080 [Klebsiella michiganensis]|nr:hypothetical protein DJ508_12080 [Klebsiella michiganensis]